MKKILLVLFSLSAVLLAKEVTVSILPQKYFVEKIAKDKIDVNVMVRKGFSPATYEPKTSQMKKLAKSEIYFSIDVPFEDVWLEKFKNSNKKMLIVDTDEGIKKREMKAHEHHEDEGNEEHHDEHDEDNHAGDDDGHDEGNHAGNDEHDEGGHAGHDHSGLDPHIWLDPVLVKVQARNIYDALVKIDEANQEFYLNNYKQFVSELEALNKELKTILSDSHDKAFMVFHPSWGYFADRYDLEEISIEIEGKEPKPAQLVELINEAKKHNIKIVFVAPQFSTKGAKTISNSINGNVSIIDPLSEEWDKNLLKVAKNIAKSYK